MGTEPVQAVEVRHEAPEDWEGADLMLPMDHAAAVVPVIPLVGIVLFFGFILVRSVP